ncbi:MAG: NFACT family protein [Lachnospiraceae bacterium]|nr:NFACT family protein [Lachnospiraceae bacterium]
MAFDGVMVAAVVSELRKKVLGARISKIQQPEKDELIITIHGDKNYKLLLSANASLPLVYLTQTNKEAPLQSPAFCMLLRKYLSSARIVDIYQPSLERVIVFKLEHLDELLDMKYKKLIIEIMGKHSNIIFCDDKDIIIDSIKRIPSSVSSVREVLPGREYFIAQTSDKLDPIMITQNQFEARIKDSPRPLYEALYTNFTGLGPVTASDICFRGGLDPDISMVRYSDDPDVLTHVYRSFKRYMDMIMEDEFEPGIVYRNGKPEEFGAFEPQCITAFITGETFNETVEYRIFDSASEMLETYYASKAQITRIKQRSIDLSKVIANAVSRAAKKYELQQKQLLDTEKREKYRIYGELLTTYGYSVEPGAKEAVLNNFYTGEDIKVPLDAELSAIDNAKAYFAKYAKLKRTYEAVTEQLEQTKEELEHLESVKHYLEMARTEDDLNQLRQEMYEAGYLKSAGNQGRGGKNGQKGGNPKGGAQKGGANRSTKAGSKDSKKPWHYVTGDGFHLYVGRNNFQNDELTFKFASNSDWWFHVKGSAGSHVILKTEGREVPDRVFEEAGALAAYYSKNREDEKVEVDYLERRNVKKPNSAKPGFVVYYTNYSLVAVPGTEGLTLVE